MQETNNILAILEAYLHDNPDEIVLLPKSYDFAFSGNRHKVFWQ